jgi:hypothetical protein
MDKYLNNDEESLFDLLEHKDADRLTADERAFVEQHISLADYELQRRMMAEAAETGTNIPEPAPLRIAQPVRAVWKGRTVPLYQAVAAVAATVALFLSLWPDRQPQSLPDRNQPQLGKTDTVFRTQIVIDTVIRYIEQREKHYAESTPDRQPDALVQAAQLRILEAGPVPLPEITEELIRTKGSSLQEDNEVKNILHGVYQANTW